MLQLLNDLLESGKYDEMYRIGMISPKWVTYRDIYLYVDAIMKAGNVNKESAVTKAQVTYNVGRTTVYKAISLFHK